MFIREAPTASPCDRPARTETAGGIVLRLRRPLGYNRTMRTISEWLLRLRGRRSSQGEVDAPAEASSSFQWIYEPMAGVGGDQFALVERPSGVPELVTIEPTVEAARAQSARPQPARSRIPSSPSTPGTLPLAGEPGRPPDLLPARYQGPQESQLRSQLDVALDRWREGRELASAMLLYDGLRALDAGTHLSSDQSSLLLRTALHYRRGALTALRYQDDPERTGLIVAEAITMPDNPMSPDAISDLLNQDPSSDKWRSSMLAELRLAASSGDRRYRYLAQGALWQIQSPPFVRAGEGRNEKLKSRRRTTIAAATAVLVVGGVVLWFTIRSRSSSSLVSLPAGQYLVRIAEGETKLATTSGFSIGRHEVTNRSYRSCVNNGGCTPLQDNAVAGISDYVDDPRYDLHPVVNVTWAQAEQFCNSRHMRLLTAEEWILAASAGPATGRPVAFPWGNDFDVQRANTFASGIGRPVEVGSFSPAGDSAIGAVDLAGNVAEWTASTSDDGATRVVKGGSYRDNSESALSYAEHAEDPDKDYDWIGFRCVAD